MTCTFVPFREASDALKRAIERAKAEDPLAPVTVVASSIQTSVQLRRQLLGSERSDGPGWANVRFVTLQALLRQSLPEARIAPDPVRVWIVKQLLSAQPGPYAECVDHPKLPIAVLRAFDSVPNTDVLEGSHLGALLDAYEASMRQIGFSDFRSLVSSQPRMPREVGQVIVHLPRRAQGITSMALQVLQRHGAWFVFGLTGDEDHDAWLKAWGFDGDSKVQIPEPMVVTACPDAEEEIREALREIWTLGPEARLERTAIVFRQPEPYARIARELLDEAGIPCFGRSLQTLADLPMGRTVLLLLDLAETGLKVPRLSGWLGSFGGRWQGKPLPENAWRRAARETRLGRVGPTFVQALRAMGQSGAGSFAEFVEWLQMRSSLLFLDPQERPWADRISDLQDVLAELFPEDLPLAEAARRANETLLSRIAALSSIEVVTPLCTGPEFAWAVRPILDNPGRPVGQLGRGVFIGTLSDARGMDLDTVFLVGASEGALPSLSRHHPILSGIRDATVPLFEQLASEWDDYIAVLGCARKSFVSFPRVDRLSGASLLPSRWISDFLRDQQVGMEQPDLWGDRFRVQPSFSHAISQNRFATDHEITVSCSVRTDRAKRWFQANKARLDDRPTVYDGHIGVEAFPWDREKPVSVTALGDFEECPYRFFLAKVLRVAELEEPEEDAAVTALDVGSAIHAALAKFFGEVQNRDWALDWSDDEKEQLRACVVAALDQIERDGKVLRPELWPFRRRELEESVGVFLEFESQSRGDRKPAKVECEVTLESLKAETAATEDGRALRLAGKIDRLDTFGDGEQMVFDFKTGRNPGKGEVPPQIGLYLLALVDSGKTGPSGAYLFMRERDSKKGVLRVDERDKGIERARALVGAFLDQAGGGAFPLNPGESWEHCRFCPYTTLCPENRSLIGGYNGVQEEVDA